MSFIVISAVSILSLFTDNDVLQLYLILPLVILLVVSIILFFKACLIKGYIIRHHRLSKSIDN